MDKNELIKIAVTAVITIIAREVVAFIFRHSKTAINIVKPISIAIFKRHWKIMPVLLDGVFFILSIWLNFTFINDESLATRKFVIFSGLNFVYALFWFNKLEKDVPNYFLELKRTRPPK
jgi:hypothetical protein